MLRLILSFGHALGLEVLAVVDVRVHQENILLVACELVLGSCSTLRTDRIHIYRIHTLPLELLLHLRILLTSPYLLDLLSLLLLIVTIEASSCLLQMREKLCLIYRICWLGLSLEIH